MGAWFWQNVHWCVHIMCKLSVRLCIRGIMPPRQSSHYFSLSPLFVKGMNNRFYHAFPLLMLILFEDTRFFEDSWGDYSCRQRFGLLSLLLDTKINVDIKMLYLWILGGYHHNVESTKILVQSPMSIMVVVFTSLIW